MERQLRRIKVKTFIVENEFQLTKADAKFVMRYARRLMRGRKRRKDKVFIGGIGVNLRLKGFEVIPLPQTDPIPPDKPFWMPGFMQRKLKGLYPDESDTLHHYIIPPVIVGRYRFFGGTSGGHICATNEERHTVASGFINDNPVASHRTKLITCAVIAAHEIAHSLGAMHNNDGLHVMNDNINMWGAHNSVRFAAITKNEVQKCLKNFS